MPPKAPPKTVQSATDPMKDRPRKYTRPVGKGAGKAGVAKKSPKKKTSITVEEFVEKKFKSLRDQIDAGFQENGLTTCNKILKLDPKSVRAIRSKVQILLSLDRHQEALDAIPQPPGGDDREDAAGGENDWTLERAYCLHKLKKNEEAKEFVEKNPDGRQERGKRILLAQIKYKLKDFEGSRDLYEDLLATCDPDSPEYDDLTANLSACNSYIDFIASAPSLISTMTESGEIPPVEELESRPVAVLLANHPLTATRKSDVLKPSTNQDRSKQSPATQAPKGAASGSGKSSVPESTSAATTATVAAKKKRIRPHQKDRKPIDPSAPPPDPERWLPKKERSSWQDLQAQRERERERAKLRAQKARKGAGGGGGGGLTQGSDSVGKEEFSSTTGGGHAGKGGGGGRKKRGGR